MKPTEQYLAALRDATAHHASSKTYSGKFLRPHAPFVKRLIDRHCNDDNGHELPVLDYGCGKGQQYEWVSHGEEASIPAGQTIEQFWGVPVTKYDPAFPPYATDAENHSGIWAPPCGVPVVKHAPGSIPLADLFGWVMPRILTLTTGAVYVAEKLGPVRKAVFSDTSSLPRWNEDDWRGFMLGMSMHRQAEELELVLSLRARDGDETRVQRWIYTRGEERTWP